MTWVTHKFLINLKSLQSNMNDEAMIGASKQHSTGQKLYKIHWAITYTVSIRIKHLPHYTHRQMVEWTTASVWLQLEIVSGMNPVAKYHNFRSLNTHRAILVNTHHRPTLKLHGYPKRVPNNETSNKHQQNGNHSSECIAMSLFRLGSKLQNTKQDDSFTCLGIALTNKSNIYTEACVS